MSTEHEPIDKRLRVLVAEDNAVSQEVAVGLLEGHGLEVDVAVSGMQAVEMAKATAYDLILMDVQMPGMDGLQATRQLREHVPTRTTPIIAMTAGKNDADEVACLAAGMNDCLGKPLDPTLLDRVLVEWVPSLRKPEPPTSKATSANTAVLPDIQDVDTAKGIAFFAGRADAYATGLKMFVGLKGPMLDAADDYLEEPTPEHRHRLHREAHSIGGACAAIGSGPVASQASSVSKLLASDAPDGAMTGDVTALVEAVKELVDHIEAALARWP